MRLDGAHGRQPSCIDFYNTWSQERSIVIILIHTGSYTEVRIKYRGHRDAYNTCKALINGPAIEGEAGTLDYLPVLKL